MMPSASKAWWGGLALVIVTLIVYLPATRGGFVWDDDDYITNNLTLRSPLGLSRVWFDIGATPQYYPLTFTSFWVEYQIWGANPLGYHVVNIVLHALNAVLLWLVLGRLGIPGAWLAAAIFALHPVQVESVTWITERKNVLSGLFYLSSLLAYLRFAGWQTPTGTRPRSRCAYGVALLLFVCALLCKTVTASLPAVLILLAWWKQGSVRGKSLLSVVPMLAIGGALALVTVWMERHTVGAEGAEWSHSFGERCLIAGRALWFYLGKLAYPVSLTFIYPRWTIDAGAWWQYLFPAASVLALLALWMLRRRVGVAPLVAALFFGLTMAPALGFLNVFPMRYSFVADHFQYLACIGPIALFAALLYRALPADRTPGRKITGAAAVRTLTGITLLAILGAMSWQRNQAFEDLETLWRDTIDKNPRCWMAYNNLGNVLYRRGDEAGAAEQYRAALRIDSELAQPLNNLGTLLQRRGQPVEARSYFLEALDADPNYADAHFNLGRLLEEQGRPAEAAEHYRKAAGINPNYVPAHYNLGNLAAKQEDFVQAVRHYREAIRIDGGHVQAHNNLGNVYALQGRFADAAAQYAQVVRINPNHALGHMNLARVLQENGQAEEAIAHYREVLRLRPGWVAVGGNLAWILATHPRSEVRDGGEAVRLALQACQAADENDATAWDVLAASYAEAARYLDAVAAARKAISVAERTNRPGLAEAIQGRLELYTQERPYRSAPDRSPTVKGLADFPTRDRAATPEQQ